MTKSADKQDDKHYEFNRGWEGGYRQGIREAFEMLVKGKESAVSEDFPNHLTLLKVPKENIQFLIAETEKELKYP